MSFLVYYRLSGFRFASKLTLAHKCTRITASPFGPYNSNYAIHADDPSLSFIYAQHVPPPGLTRNFIALICAREGIHPSRVQIYLAQDDKNEGPLELPRVEPVEDNAKLLLRKGGCGSNELNPLLVHITVSRPRDRNGVSQRRSVFVTGGEQAAAMTSQGCSALGSCLRGFFNEFPAGHCTGFRNGWIAFWSCGNPNLYSRNPRSVCNFSQYHGIIVHPFELQGITCFAVVAGFAEVRIGQMTRQTGLRRCNLCHTHLSGVPFAA